MVGKTALNKEMKHLNGAYFRTISENFSKDEIQKRDNKSFRTKQFDARREKIQVLFF